MELGSPRFFSAASGNRKEVSVPRLGLGGPKRRGAISAGPQSSSQKNTDFGRRALSFMQMHLL